MSKEEITKHKSETHEVVAAKFERSKSKCQIRDCFPTSPRLRRAGIAKFILEQSEGLRMTAENIEHRTRNAEHQI